MVFLRILFTSIIIILLNTYSLASEKPYSSSDFFNIYDKLKSFVHIDDLPELIIRNGIEEGAKLDTYEGKVVIFVDSTFLEVCESKSEIAFLLAHELGHFYDLGPFNDRVIKTTLLNCCKNTHTSEPFADIFGAMLCWMAGFDFRHGQLEYFFLKVYRHFESNHGTYSILDRIASRNRAVEKIEDFTVLYDLATYLSLFHQYDFAQSCLYEFQSIFENSPPLYNNLGAINTLAALANLRSSEPEKYNIILPIEINNTPFPKKRERFLADNTDSLLNSAIKKYSRSIQLAPKYYSAYINRACAFILKGEYKKATEDLTFVKGAFNSSRLEKEAANKANQILVHFNTGGSKGSPKNSNFSLPLHSDTKTANFIDDYDWSNNIEKVDESLYKMNTIVSEFQSIESNSLERVDYGKNSEGKIYILTTKSNKIRIKTEACNSIITPNENYQTVDFATDTGYCSLYRSDKFFLVNIREGIAYLCQNYPNGEIWASLKCTIATP